jgi:hypothetical protein
MILEPPASVQKLQTALQAKAKEAPDYRFYLLYDKLYRKDVLEYAYRCCKANGGAPGVDGQDFADIEAYGEERWLGELAGRLRGKTYRAEAVRRVWIPKPDGRKRPLRVPCVADRTVMTAAVVVLSPIFEVDIVWVRRAKHTGRSIAPRLDGYAGGYARSIRCAIRARPGSRTNICTARWVSLSSPRYAHDFPRTKA